MDCQPGVTGLGCDDGTIRHWRRSRKRSRSRSVNGSEVLVRRRVFGWRAARSRLTAVSSKCVRRAGRRDDEAVALPLRRSYRRPSGANEADRTRFPEIRQVTSRCSGSPSESRGLSHAIGLSTMDGLGIAVTGRADGARLVTRDAQRCEHVHMFDVVWRLTSLGSRRAEGRLPAQGSAWDDTLTQYLGTGGRHGNRGSTITRVPGRSR